MTKWRPKIMISKPKYTFGGEYSTPSGNDYTGRYYQDYAGNTFEGASPTTTTTQLTPVQPLDEPRQLAFELNLPTEQDYTRGSFTRFFLLDKRNGKIIEVRKNTYLREVIYTSYIKGANLSWRLSGPIEDRDFNSHIYTGAMNSNKQAVAEASKKIKGLDTYITDYTQYIRENESNVVEDLYTAGKELYIKGTLDEYVGKYHIHPSLGIMQGSVHTEMIHNHLIPQNESIRLKFIAQYPFLAGILTATPIQVTPRPKLPTPTLEEDLTPVPLPRPSDNVVDTAPRTPFEVKDPDLLPKKTEPVFTVQPGSGGPLLKPTTKTGPVDTTLTQQERPTTSLKEQQTLQDARIQLEI